MLSPYKLTWQNYSSLEFDVWCELSFDSANGETDTYLTREAVASESYNGTFQRAYNYKWSEVFTFSVTFVKQNYEDFTEIENRKILRWLTGSSKAAFVDIYRDDSEAIWWSSIGNWTNVLQYKAANGRIIGYIAEFTSLTPWALSPLRCVTKNIGETSVTLNVRTDDSEFPIYPRVTIQQDSASNIITIHRIMTDSDKWEEGTVYYNDVKGEYYWVDGNGIKHTSSTNDSEIETTSVSISNAYVDIGHKTQVYNSVVKNNIKGETIVLDGTNKVVKSSRTNGRIFGDDFSWQWLPLFEGENIVTVTGNCVATFEWREPIKVGEF